MIHNTTGKAVDTERNYRYTHKAYNPLSRGGDLYGRGKNSPYSACMKGIKVRMAPELPVMAGYNVADLEQEHITLTLAKNKAVKLIKHRR